MIWITGEVSNLRTPASGHLYFQLKDADAQLSAVMFRMQIRQIPFTLENGMAVTGLGRISVYEPRGTYQIILEYLEPRGIGALQAAFEQLKARLSQEGLFDDGRKKGLPYLPKRIGVVTSGSGAVVHDIIHVITRRFYNIHLFIRPVKVQGYGSEQEISQAITDLNDLINIDLIILARGGGSLEDLQAFNSEAVARAIYRSHIPIISGVGHETDVTIADLVADVRAPTPSAAAEMAVPVRMELAARIGALRNGLSTRVIRLIQDKKDRLAHLTRRIPHPSRRISDAHLRLDDFRERLTRHSQSMIARQREKHGWQDARLRLQNPLKQVAIFRERMGRIVDNLIINLNRTLGQKQGMLRDVTTRLETLNPTAVLERGYGIAYTIPEGQVIRDAARVTSGSSIAVRLARGILYCQVERIGKEDGSR